MNHPPQTDPRLVGTDIVDSVIDTIGNTPLIRLKRLSELEGIECVFAMKNEATNPGGSAKDRPALEMILAAEQDGLLQPGGTIVEPTSGNTGVGLAIVAAQRGYQCVFVMTDKVAPEKISLLKARWPSSPTTLRATTASPNASRTSSARSGPTSTRTPTIPKPM